MKNILLLIVFFYGIIGSLSARVIKVDINGSGQFTTISAALNAAVNGDTIKVLPGVYDGAITISKDVVLMGSGYETTKITANSNPAIKINGGKIMWFAITSNAGNGVEVNAGIITNSVIRSCSGAGIYFPQNSTGIACNCVIYGNNAPGALGTYPTNAFVYNCISWGNSDVGYSSNFNVSYSLGSTWNVYGKNGMIDTNPSFTSNNDYHISPQSPCWDKGKPDILDPDGSQSDIGYFGGPDCPIYPVVTNVKIIPQTDGSIKIEATGVANY